MLLRRKSGAWSTVAIAIATFPILPILPVLLPAPAHAEPPSTTEVSFTGAGGVRLHGTILAPAAHRGDPRPGIVMVHGAGPVTRSELRTEAEAYARRGIATLIYDKRTVGYSTVQRNYGMLATDALAAVRVLRRHPGVDPELVGIWGLSEGAWVAPIAATRSPDVAFVVVAGAIGTTPARQQAWAYEQRLRHAGVEGSFVDTMRKRLIRFALAAGLFGEADHDPVASWRQVRQPVLAVWGELDREALPAESSRIIRRALEQGGNAHYAIRFLPGVRHNLNGTADDGFDRPDLVPSGYGAREAAWIQGLADGPPAVHVDAPAPAASSSRAVDGPSAWYESPWWQLAAVVMFLAAGLGYVVTALVRRFRGDRGAPPAARPARWCVLTLLATVVGFVGYLGVQIVTGAYVLGPVVAGRTVPWLVLQVLAVAVVVTGVLTAVTAFRRRGELTAGNRVRLGLTLGAVVAFVPWAVFWGLLT